MSKEIKFRGYLKDSFFKGKEKHPSYEPLLDKRIVKIHSIHFNSKKVIISCPTGGNMSVEFKDIEIMQYTGLKDKNGKEIYEGDIVRKCNVNYIVMFDPQGYWCLDGNGALNSEMLSSELPHFEVIGNIYESEVEDEKINC